MSINLGDIFLRILGDTTPAEQAVAKVGESPAAAAAGQKAGGLFAKAFGGTTAKIVNQLGATALFGTITALGKSLGDALVNYQAETGATAEEVKAAQPVIDHWYKTSLESFDTLGQLASKLHNELGLVGEDSQRIGSMVLDYARATHQEAIPATDQFVTLAKAYNLTADEQVAILDQLVASHQKYGGSVAENAAELAQLAPALTAANLTYQDGIGLLNLFAKAGVDASAAPLALQHALGQVHSPEELKQLILKIEQTPNAFDRAKMAVDLFGARAGPKLALALAQGQNGFDDFTVSASDAAGAVQKASDAIESTPFEQLKLLIRQVTGPLADLGAAFQPIFAALTSLPLVANLTFSDVFAGSKKLVNGFKAIGGALLDAIAGAVVPASAAGGTLGTAMGAAEAEAEVATASTGVAAGQAEIAAAGSASAAASGGLLGKIMGTGLRAGLVLAAAGLWLEVINTYNEQKDKLEAQGKAIGTSVGSQVQTGTLDQLEQSKAALEQGIAQLNGIWDLGILTSGPRENLEKQLDAVNQAIEEKGAEAAKLAQTAGTNTSQGFAAGIAAGAAAAGAAAVGVADKSVAGFANAARIRAYAAGAAMDFGSAQGIRDKRGAITSAIAQLRDDMKHALSKGHEIGRLAGQATSAALARGLRSHDPEVRAQAKGVADLIDARLVELVQSGGKVGKAVLEDLNRKMHSKDPDVRAQAKATKKVLDAALTSKVTAKTPGQAIGDQLNHDLGTKGTELEQTAYRLGRNIYEGLVAGVQGGGLPTSGATSGGGHVTNRAIGGYASGLTLIGEKGPELLDLPSGSRIVTNQETREVLNSTGGIGPISIAVDARGQANPPAIGAAVRQGVADAMADIMRKQRARLPAQALG